MYIENPLQDFPKSYPKYDNKGNDVGKFWRGNRQPITQKFGNKLIVNGKEFYKQWGLDGHDGLDLRASTGTKVFSPINGYAIARKSKDGYGWHIRLRCPWHGVEIILAHLSKFPEGTEFETEYGVGVHDLIGYSGGAEGTQGAGSSLAPHLHFAVRYLEAGDPRAIFSWPVKDKGNGYSGYIDPAPHTATWKGTYATNSL